MAQEQEIENLNIIFENIRNIFVLTVTYFYMLCSKAISCVNLSKNLYDYNFEACCLKYIFLVH